MNQVCDILCDYLEYPEFLRCTVLNKDIQSRMNPSENRQRLLYSKKIFEYGQAISVLWDGMKKSPRIEVCDDNLIVSGEENLTVIRPWVSPNMWSTAEALGLDDVEIELSWKHQDECSKCARKALYKYFTL